jgi:hypothetical protein
MSIPPVDHGEGFDDPIDPLFLERQRRRYASRAIAYLVLLNGVAALIMLASLPQLAGQVSKPIRIVDAMLVFGVGAAIALGSTFFAYVRRTVRLQAPERVPLRVTLWWLSVLAALAAAAFFLIGLNMAGRAVLQERPGISSGATVKGDTQRKHEFRKKRDGRKEGKRDKRNEDEKEDEEENQRTQSGPGAESESTGAETTPAAPLSRSQCEQAGRTWNEGSNTCN